MSLDDLPGVAEVAMQSGRHAGEDVRRSLAGEPSRPFPYRDLGNAAYISRRHALLEKGRLRVDGFVGWVLWGAIHIAFLAGVHKPVHHAAELGDRPHRQPARGAGLSARQPDDGRAPLRGGVRQAGAGIRRRVSDRARAPARSTVRYPTTPAQPAWSNTTPPTVPPMLLPA
jgi:hypothetical protein